MLYPILNQCGNESFLVSTDVIHYSHFNCRHELGSLWIPGLLLWMLGGVNIPWSSRPHNGLLQEQTRVKILWRRKLEDVSSRISGIGGLPSCLMLDPNCYGYMIRVPLALFTIFAYLLPSSFWCLAHTLQYHGICFSDVDVCVCSTDNTESREGFAGISPLLPIISFSIMSCDLICATDTGFTA